MADQKLNWVFDSLVEFLKGPVWNIPILTFIEQKSVVFEPGAENEREFMKIHNHYKNLVDFMLGSYMEDIHITPNQFETACAMASKKSLTQFHQNLFEQVWAADDFEIFRRMMTQKNLELQLQALEVLAQKYGITPDFSETPTDNSQSTEEEKLLKEIIRQSLAEDVCNPTQTNESQNEVMGALAEKERLETERQIEKDLMDQAIKCSINDKTAESKTPAPSPTDVPHAETPTLDIAPALTEVVSSQADKLDKPTLQEESPKKTSNNNNDIPENVSLTVPKVVEPSQIENDENNSAAEALVDSNEENEKFLSCVGTPVDPEAISIKNMPWSEGDQKIYIEPEPRTEILPIEMEKRQNYLRQQRDKLLEMKRQERTKSLNNYEEKAVVKRPKSAKAARRIVEQKHEDIDPQTLAFRKSLASRLRSEVIDISDIKIE